MIHVSRQGWNARPPESTTPLVRSRITNFIVHYSGASRDQTVRSIQNFCMDNKGHVDIDYNRIVHGDYDYMGRGWNVGGHTLNNNSTSYGVCVIGQDGDATDADFRTVRGIYDEVCASLGRQITMTTHRGVLGASYTSCPGLELHNWVMAGMPVSDGGGNMSEAQTNSLFQATFEGGGSCGFHRSPNNGLPPSNSIIQKLDYLGEKLDLPSPVPVTIDPEVLVKAFKTALLSPEVLTAIATAVNVDHAERLAKK